MKTDRYGHLLFRWLPGTIVSLHLLISSAFAGGADEAGGWRSTYDEIMMWVNFAIFVFVIVKFARAPLADFLKGKKEEIADEIAAVETKKQQAESDVREIAQQLEESNLRLEQIKTRIVRQGERRKAQIIADARAESETMLNATRTKIQGQIASAHARLRTEMIDKAIDMALKRLPDEITAQDDTNIVNTYLAAMTD